MDFGPMQSEALTLKYIPQLIRLKTFLQKQYGIGVLENIDKYYAFLEKNGQTAYIKPQNYAISKTRKYLTDVSKFENMQYDDENDHFVCKNGKILRAF